MKHLKYIFIGLLLFVFILINVVEVYTFNHDYYLSEFDKYDVYKDVDLGREGVDYASGEIISYLKNDRNDLNVIYEGIDVFNQREISHMVDVKRIFTVLKYVKFFSVLLGILMIVLDKSVKTVVWSLIYTGIHSLIMMSTVIVLAINDFTSAFIKFHEMFFSNELWLLNPVTDRLIQMLPEGFFLDMALSIGITHLSITLTLAIIAVYNFKKIKA
ncbi:MAG: TIGR01906 family membrane protein [Clostridiales bacterium]|nr:TIGR01906 family membrane protein [Clostridiales bacterium]